MFDFSKTDAASESSYLTPGIYTVKCTKGEFGNTKEKNTPFVALTFETSEGLAITEKFMITEKAIGRLQYLHEAWSGKKLDKAFKTPKEVADYFIKSFTAPKAGSKNLVVGGETNGQVTYGSLPYTNFIAPKDAELGAFEEGDDNWKKYVKKSTRTSEASGQRQGALNSSSATSSSNDSSDSDTDDTPW